MLFKKKKKIGLALGSGGAKGLAHIAFLKVLDELEIKPSIISGSSIGAMIGALYACGYSGKEIEKIYSDFDMNKIRKLLDVSFRRKHGIMKGDKISLWLKDLIRCVDFKDLNIPLKIVAADYWSHEEVIFTKGDIIDAVRSSISIPGIFEPTVINDRVLVDGGVLNPVPFDIIKDDCNLLIAIDVLDTKKIKNIHPDRPNLFECIYSTFEMMQNSIENNKLRSVVPDLHVKLSLRNISILDFHKKDEIFSQVSDDVIRFKKELKHKLRL